MDVQSFNLKEYLAARKALVEQALSDSLPVSYPESLYNSMRYSLLAGGKRLRPILCLAACELAGGDVAQALPTACALEMIHTMSLIHDDLPAMDNDDYRRGQLTNHKVFGDAMAILAGDALLAYAFQVVAEETQNVDPYRLLQVIGRLGKAVAASGLVGGQVVDLESEGKPIPLETLDFIHAHKTGALLEVSVVSGGLLGGADAEMVQNLTDYAHDIGLAFQIIDDILDVTATSEQLGKTAGKDVVAAKATYPSIWGIEVSRQKAEALIQSAKQHLAPHGQANVPLLALADFITQRTH